jgi:hypothetical protein
MIAHLRHENGAAWVQAARPTERGVGGQAGVPIKAKRKADVGGLDKSTVQLIKDKIAWQKIFRR